MNEERKKRKDTINLVCVQMLRDCLFVHKQHRLIVLTDTCRNNLFVAVAKFLTFFISFPVVRLSELSKTRLVCLALLSSNIKFLEL